MNTALQQQRLEVEQLRREAAMKRIPVSQAVDDIKVRLQANKNFLGNGIKILAAGKCLDMASIRKKPVSLVSSRN